MISLGVGDVIAGYRLDELAGRGGMGVVFQATHIALERRVAVKLIAPELAANEQFRERFKRESRVAASIDHAHVIPIFDAGDEDGQLYVAMRYVDGTDLGELIARQGKLPPLQAVELTAQVGEGLDVAHERGLVHRDVKPANVLLESRGSGYHSYLTDFGLVKTVGEASGVLTRTGQWLGTPDYAAPEQITGADVDARTDVYALGCMLYHMIAGKPPFEGDTDVAKMFAHMSQPPGSLSEVQPGVPAELDEVIRTALAKDPAERHRSAGELASAARRAIGEDTRAGAAKAVGAAPTETPHEDETVVSPREPRRIAAPLAETAATPSASPRSERPNEAVERPSSRNRWLVLAAALVLLGGGALAFLVAGGGDEEPAAAAVPEGNLTSNPSFERSGSGWDSFESDLAREGASDAPDGENVARVTLSGSSGEYSVDDEPETVSSSQKGRYYTASAWVKATEATDGARICISLREGLPDGDEDFPFSTASVEASADEYREVRVTHRAAADGKPIGVHVFRAGEDVSEGESFLVDAISITESASGEKSKSTDECDA